MSMSEVKAPIDVDELRKDFPIFETGILLSGQRQHLAASDLTT
jgi:hypothetical protein